MGLARELERRLERLVDGATAAVFRGRMHPVDMAEHLVRPVEFVAEVEAMYRDGARTFLELGPAETRVRELEGVERHRSATPEGEGCA